MQSSSHTYAISKHHAKRGGKLRLFVSNKHIQDVEYTISVDSFDKRFKLVFRLIKEAKTTLKEEEN